MDRPSATAQRCGEVESAIFDLFAQLGASEEQLDFPVLYASAREVGSFPASLLACWRSLGSVSFGRDLFGASLLGEIFLIVDNEREPAVNDGLHDTITSPTRAPDACNLQGWAATALPEPGQPPEGASVAPLLDTIARSVPSALRGPGSALRPAGGHGGARRLSGPRRHRQGRRRGPPSWGTACACCTTQVPPLLPCP